MQAYSHALKITLTHATELTKGDFLGTCDPYVTLAIDSDKQQHARSSDRQGTLNPVWGPPERFDLKVIDPLTQRLQAQVWAHHLILPDHLLGSVAIPLKDFDAQNNAPVVGYELRSKTDRASGQLFLQISVQPFSYHEIILELWENEWYSLTDGWTSEESSLLQQHLHWSSEDGGVSHKDFMHIAPKPPVNFSTPGWNIDATKDDVNGWFYATTFWAVVSGEQRHDSRPPPQVEVGLSNKHHEGPVPADAYVLGNRRIDPMATDALDHQ